MKNKGLSICAAICGLLFVIFGIVLFSIQKGDTIVIIVAGLDLLFGISLIAGSLIKNKSAAAKPQWEDYPADNQQYTPEPYPETEADDLTDDIDDLDLLADPAELAARENELRAAAKRAAEEATRAKKIATAAVQEAKRAEEELHAAEDELANLDSASQRAAMRRIDMLAQTAAEKSEIAVSEARKAKLAIRNAREAAELHSKAMDAAAAALSGEDEFAEFN